MFSLRAWSIKAPNLSALTFEISLIDFPRIVLVETPGDGGLLIEIDFDQLIHNLVPIINEDYFRNVSDGM